MDARRLSQIVTDGTYVQSRPLIGADAVTMGTMRRVIVHFVH
jgi:hypothetical protein